MQLVRHLAGCGREAPKFSVTQMSSLPLAFQVFAQILLPRLPFLGAATVQYSTRLSAFPTDYDLLLTPAGLSAA